MATVRQTESEAVTAILTELLVLQGMLHVLPSKERAGEYVSRTLSLMRGCASCAVCYRVPSPDSENPKIESCSGCVVDDDVPVNGLCSRQRSTVGSDIRSYPLETGTAFYGQLVLRVDDAEEIAFFEPFLFNLADSIAVAAENRSQRVLIKEANNELTLPRDHLERLVEERTEALRQSEERFRTIADYTYGQESRIGSDGVPRWINPAGTSLTGYDVEEGLVMENYPLPMIHEDDRAGMAKRLESALAGSTRNDISFRIRRKDKSVEWMALSWQPLYRDDGGADGYRASAQRITKRMKAEETARLAQHELLAHREREKKQVEAELTKVRAELVHKARLATIGQVAASIAHGLRKPLGAAHNATYYLKRHTTTENPKLLQYLGIIDKEIDAAARVIDVIMEMAHSKTPVAELIDLRQSLDEVMERIQPPESITCKVELGSFPFLVLVDPGQLKQVLNNILVNAMQQMDHKGIVRVRAERADNYDTITISDSGPGVTPEIREQMFEPPFTTKAKGTGLGLTICRQIVERHGGPLELIDQESPGAAFCIRLPQFVAPIAVPKLA